METISTHDETQCSTWCSTWYSVDEVAREYNVSAYVVRAMIRDGQLPAVKIGREWRIPKDSLPRPAQKGT